MELEAAKMIGAGLAAKIEKKIPVLINNKAFLLFFFIFRK